MNKLHRKITQSRIRAIRSGLKKLKGKYPSYLKGQYTPEQIKQLDKKFVDGSSHSACLILLQRSDKWLLRTFDMIKGVGELATCRGAVDFWLHDQRLVAHYIVYGKLELSEHGKAFYEESDNLKYIIPYMENFAIKCLVYERRKATTRHLHQATLRHRIMIRQASANSQPNT